MCLFKIISIFFIKQFAPIDLTEILFFSAPINRCLYDLWAEISCIVFCGVTFKETCLSFTLIYITLVNTSYTRSTEFWLFCTTSMYSVYLRQVPQKRHHTQNFSYWERLCLSAIYSANFSQFHPSSFSTDSSIIFSSSVKHLASCYTLTYFSVILLHSSWGVGVNKRTVTTHIYSLL